MEDFPGNSHSAKLMKEQRAAGEDSEAAEGPITSAQQQYDEQAAENSDGPPKVKKVVTGKVTQRKKGLGAQFRDIFVGEEDRESFAEHLVNNVAVPMVKEMIVSIVAQTLDGIKDGVEDFIRPGSRGDKAKKTISYGTGRPHVNYTEYSNRDRRSSRTAPPAPRMTIRRSNRVQEILLESRQDGEDVIEELQAKIDGFGHCTVGDLYAAVGKEPRSTDELWGWDMADFDRQARVRRLATGEFLLWVPRPIEIDS